MKQSSPEPQQMQQDWCRVCSILEKGLMMTDIRVVPDGQHHKSAQRAEFAWPVTVTCGCGRTENLRVLTDDVCSRAAALHAIDNYLDANGWIPRLHASIYPGLETCDDCRATAAKITKQVNALTAPGDPPKPARATPAQVTDELDRLTAMPDTNTGETSIISKSTLPDLNVDLDLSADPNGTAATVPDDIETDPLAGAEEWTCPVCGAGNPESVDVCEDCGNDREPVGLDRPIDQ